MRRSARFRFLAVMATLAVPLCVPPGAAATPQASWTILVYMDADNDLEQWTFQNMAELESVGSNEDVRILVQIDRIAGYSDEDGDWTGARRYEAQRADEPRYGELASPVLEELGEVNMGDPATLVEFLVWGVERAPADHYMVLLWDHGGAWDGIAWDDTDGFDRLLLSELDVAFEYARAATGVERFDIVAMDACLMMTVEVAHALSPHAGILLSSEEVIPEEGFPYADFVAALQADPDLSPEDFADHVVVLFRGRYDGSWRSQSEDPISFLSWLRLSAEPAFFEATQGFMEAIRDAAPAEWAQIVTEGRRSEHFPNPSQEESIQLDLLDFAVNVGLAYTAGPLREAVEALLGAGMQIVGGTYNPPGHPRATGVSAWFPLPDQGDLPETPPAVLPGIEEAVRALWDAAENADAEAPTFDGFGVDRETVTPEEPVTVSATVVDAHLYETYAVLTDEGGDESLIVQFLEARYDLEADDESGGLFEFEWDGFGYALSNETHYVVAPFYPAQPGSDFLFLDGTYYRAADDAEFPGALVFDRESGQLVAAWDLSDAVAALAPRLGDAFAPDYLSFDAEGNSETVAGERMEATADGNDAWTVYVGAFTEGEYGLAIYAADLAGNAAITETAIVELGGTDGPTSGWVSPFGPPATKKAGAMNVFALVSLVGVASWLRRTR